MAGRHILLKENISDCEKMEEIIKEFTEKSKRNIEKEIGLSERIGLSVGEWMNRGKSRELIKAIASMETEINLDEMPIELVDSKLYKVLMSVWD